MSGGLTPAGRSKGTVLIIEDDRDIREVLEWMISSAGYRVRVAVDGADGKRMMESGERPDLILLDMRMPRIDGNEFLHFAKDSDELRRVPIVLMSASRPNPISLERADGFIPKPMETDDIFRMLDDFHGLKH